MKMNDLWQGSCYKKTLVFVYTKVYTDGMKNVRISGFQWDDGNREKCQKHGVSITEVEFVLSNEFAMYSDEQHSGSEPRFLAIGKNGEGRSLFIAFTLRRYGSETFIRPISVRYMHQKEVEYFEKENPRT